MIEDFRGFEGKIVAVTGASGYIGSALTKSLSKVGANVIRVSRRPQDAIPGVSDLLGDVRTVECWKEILDTAEIVFHLAGNTSVYTAAANPVESLTATLSPVNNLISVAQETNKIPRVVFSSTATVYGLTENLPVSETASSTPITLYDLHKRFAEDQLALASRQGILHSISLRLSNVYGPSPSSSSANDRGVLNMISQRALLGMPLSLYGDGEYLRDYVYIDDVVRAFMCAGLSGGHAGLLFNVASGEGTTLRDAFNTVIEHAAKITGKMVEISHVPWPDDASPIEFRNFVGDGSAIYDALNWHSQVSLLSGVGKMIDGFHKSAGDVLKKLEN